MPAGHNWPPHSETSVWSWRGGFRRPLKSRETIWEFWISREGMRSSEIVRWERGNVGSSSSDGEDDIVGLLLLWAGTAFGGVGRLDLYHLWGRTVVGR